MPQFDLASFFPQVSFFAIIFLSFYLILAKKILPLISQNLKLFSKLHAVLPLFNLNWKRLAYIYSFFDQKTAHIFFSSIVFIFLNAKLSIFLQYFLKTKQMKTKIVTHFTHTHWVNYQRIYLKFLDQKN